MLTENQLSSLVHRGNTIHDDFALVAAQCADNIAISGYAVQLTYRDVTRIARQCEMAIRNLDGLDHSPVVICLKNDIRLYALFLGVMRSGRPYFYIDPDDSVLAKQALLEKVGAKLVIGDKIIGDASVINIDLETILAVNVASLAIKNHEIDPATASCLVQTSGTTMHARAVAISHAALRHNVANYQMTLKITPQDRLSLLTTPQFCAANSAIYGALLSGACLLPFAVKTNGLIELIEWLAREAVTVLHLTPSLFRLLAKYIPENALPSIRAVKLGGEPVYPADVSLFKSKFSRDCMLVNGLGMSEAGGNIAHFIIQHDTWIAPELSVVPVGSVLNGHHVTIVDDDKKPVRAGETGEIVISGEFLSNGYWNEDAVVNQMFYTNDVGYFLPDGSLVHIGRKNRLVKRHGFRVDLNVIEAVLLDLKSINNAAVYFTTLNADQEALVACIELIAGASEDGDSIRYYLAEKLPAHMVPQYYFFLSRFPLTHSGKIDRRAVLNDVNRLQTKSAGVKPRNELERQMLALWQKILTCEEIGVYDNFFASGGDSLRALEFIARLERDYQINYSLSSLAAHPTIAQIAEDIAISVVNDQQQTVMPFSVTLLTLEQKPEHKSSLVFLPGGAMSEKEILLFAGLLPFLTLATAKMALRSNLPQNGVEVPQTVEMIAAAIAAEIKNNARGVPVLIGECLACVLTLEVARQLAEKLTCSPRVVLLNPWHPRLVTEQTRQVNPAAVTAYHQLLKCYTPKAYDGQVDIVLAQDQPRSLQDCRDWWESRLQTPCAIHIVPGNGESYIRSQRRFLAQKINEIDAYF